MLTFALSVIIRVGLVGREKPLNRHREPVTGASSLMMVRLCQATKLRGGVLYYGVGMLVGPARQSFRT
jgi:hypothetical protein